MCRACRSGNFPHIQPGEDRLGALACASTSTGASEEVRFLPEKADVIPPNGSIALSSLDMAFLLRDAYTKTFLDT